jgi:uncharacterized protein (DUF433 family)
LANIAVFSFAMLLSGLFRLDSWLLILGSFLCKFVKNTGMFIYKDIITIEDGKRSGKPCIRGMRISVEDILGCLASEMSIDDIINDFPELTRQDIIAALEFSATRQHRTLVAT